MKLHWSSIVLLFMAVGCADEPRSAASAIDFHRDVAPIFRAKCGSCHGPTQQLGGLRLDQRDGALAGGLSGKRLIAAKWDESELLRRVESDDPAIVMPKEGGKLSTEELGLLREWLRAGASWPDVVRPTGPKEFWVRYRRDAWERLSVVGGEPKVYLLLAIALFALIAERLRRVPLERRSQGVRRRLADWFRNCPASAAWLLIVALIAVEFIQFSMRQSLELARQDIQLRERANVANPTFAKLSGTRPAPLRPRAVLPFGGTYYRGNDERNERLFNGGYYRTATMRLALRDEMDRPVELGSTFTGLRLFVTLEIERAVQATPSLFTDKMMSEVMLSRRTSDQKEPFPADEPARLSVVEPGQRWIAKYHIGEYAGESDAALQGTIYVVAGAKTDREAVTGSIHYGIVYSLRIRDRTLQANSELWIGPILVPGNFQAIEPDKISLPEWLDLYPIPEIVGEGSTDPDLLGIQQHLDKGAKLPDSPPQKPEPKKGE